MSASFDWRMKQAAGNPHYDKCTPLWEPILEAQGGVCRICKKPAEESAHAMSVDHNHTTNAVRGLLCHSCNVQLGWYENNRAEVDAYLLRDDGFLK